MLALQLKSSERLDRVYFETFSKRESHQFVLSELRILNLTQRNNQALGMFPGSRKCVLNTLEALRSTLKSQKGFYFFLNVNLAFCILV